MNSLKSKIVVVYSGGLDSTVLLYSLMQQNCEVSCLNFYYGSKHNVQEGIAARNICSDLGVSLKSINLSFINVHFKSDLLLTGGKIPEGHYQDESMKKTVVPFRNGIMLSIAAGYAESIDFDGVSIAVHSGDHTIYPDCRPDFVTNMESAIAKGTWKNIILFAPFTYMTKADIIDIGDKVHAPLSKTYSCYNGGELHCGVCGACTERKMSFKMAEVEDNTVYMK